MVVPYTGQFRYLYRLSEPYTAEHALLSSVSTFPEEILEIIYRYSWYGLATSSSPISVEHWPSTVGIPTAEQVSLYNKYLLDNKLPSGGEPGFQPGREILAATPFLGSGRNWENLAEMARQAAQSTVSMRVNQPLVDGNHRTSILMLYESLAEQGWELRCEPFEVYVIISNRSQAPWEDVVQNLAEVVEKRMVHRTLSAGERERIAEQVKNIPVVSAALEAVNVYCQNREIALDMRRGRYRELMRENQAMKIWFRELYPGEILR